jgi:hypothetical protein
MMKRVLMTTAVCGMMATAGLAQAQTAQPQMQTGTSGAQMGGGDFIAAQDQKHWLADDLIGTEVKNADETIGEIENLVFDDGGKAVGAVISVGQFLGVGGKNVAVPFDKLQISPDPNDPNDYLVSVVYTKEQLEQAPPFKTLEDEKKDAARSSAGSAAPGGTAAPPGGMGSGSGGAMGTAPGTSR